VSLWYAYHRNTDHRYTENTEDAQRKQLREWAN
jgi:hypothetical protein